MRNATAAFLLAVAVLVGGCSRAAIGTTTGPTAASAPAPGSSLSPSDFAAAVKLPDTVLLDVRTPSEFAAGHIEGAINIDVESASFAQNISKLTKSANYAVYCRSGNRSKTAMTAMQKAGLSHLFDLAGGITAWQSSGGKIVTGS